MLYSKQQFDNQRMENNNLRTLKVMVMTPMINMIMSYSAFSAV